MKKVLTVIVIILCVLISAFLGYYIGNSKKDKQEKSKPGIEGIWRGKNVEIGSEKYDNEFNIIFSGNGIFYMIDEGIKVGKYNFDENSNNKEICCKLKTILLMYASMKNLLSIVNYWEY